MLAQVMDVHAFIVVQLLGAVAALYLSRWLLGERPPARQTVRLPAE